MIKRATALAATLALTAPAVAHTGFKEHVKVLWQHTGEEGKYYAWGVAPLADINRDGVNDISVGSYTQQRRRPGRREDPDLLRPRSRRTLRTITSTTEGENLGFDAVGIGDVNRDHRPDLLASAAEGDTLRVIAGRR